MASCSRNCEEDEGVARDGESLELKCQARAAFPGLIAAFVIAAPRREHNESRHARAVNVELPADRGARGPRLQSWSH